MTKAQQARLVAWRLKVLNWAQGEPVRTDTATGLRLALRECRFHVRGRLRGGGPRPRAQAG